ncbi:MAG: hypothetical protein JWR16_813 [Nevskia sp.]|nr:hypothetical protein [Nevskia sp.]
MNLRNLFSVRGKLLVMLLVTGAAQAAPQAIPTADSAPQLDQNLQVLKEEAVNIKAELQSTEQTLLYPDATRVIIYFSVPVSGLLVQSITVSVDDGRPFQYKYINAEAIALQRRGIQPLVKLNAGAGTHRIRADIVAQFADAQASTPPLADHLEATFTKARAAANIELSLARRSVVSRPELELHEWVADK